MRRCSYACPAKMAMAMLRVLCVVSGLAVVLSKKLVRRDSRESESAAKAATTAKAAPPTYTPLNFPTGERCDDSRDGNGAVISPEWGWGNFGENLDVTGCQIKCTGDLSCTFVVFDSAVGSGACTKWSSCESPKTTTYVGTFASFQKETAYTALNNGADFPTGARCKGKPSISWGNFGNGLDVTGCQNKCTNDGSCRFVVYNAPTNGPTTCTKWPANKCAKGAKTTSYASTFTSFQKMPYTCPDGWNNCTNR